jgi:hypothetical protein
MNHRIEWTGQRIHIGEVGANESKPRFGQERTEKPRLATMHPDNVDSDLCHSAGHIASREP